MAGSSARENGGGQQARRIDVQIDELLVEASGPYQADALARAAEDELARLLAGGELPAGLLHGLEVSRLDGGDLEGRPGASAQALGRGIGRAIYRSLSGGVERW